ncbi:MAG: PAS domain-containing protein [Gammaproteobacteria bacterium]|nr:PAS domain-containing protein [Gammaproteobacteria bacterium]NNF62158.1 PAS domain-containing protein [Gammaproteobacteria bacterium]NNM21849.1 PAS domain-containing protein [Gammaproteobacteria bacterium]
MQASEPNAAASPAPAEVSGGGLAGVATQARAPDLAWRVISLLNIYRVFVAVALLVLFAITSDPRIIGTEQPQLFIAVACAYLICGLFSWWAIANRIATYTVQISIQLAIDIAAVTVLMHASGGIQSGLGNLLIISMGAASLMMPARTAVSFAAIAALTILFEQALSQFEGITTAADYTASGVLGAIVFLISVAAQPLARRIAESDALAEQRGVDLANLAELNEYIVQHLRESIVVIDDANRVRLMNASAAKHLGISWPAGGRPLRDISPELYELTSDWRRHAGEVQTGFSPFAAADGATLITPHFAPLGRARPAAALIFLEDATQLSERVQQAKLAALGRLSASIAHEIRNPVGAISHAGQLLAESDAIPADERRLTDIIHKQAGRVNTIIENVLQLSRRDNTRPQQIVLGEWLADFVSEFAAANQLGDSSVSIQHDEPELAIRFDPSHLHQVLWNLCENAVRYARAADGAVTLSMYSGRHKASDRPVLEVLDRGSGIADELVDRIFEPFFTAAHDGTGLGLFIARELCDCNNAGLRYLRREGGGSRFQIIFADPQRWTV